MKKSLLLLAFLSFVCSVDANARSKNVERSSYHKSISKASKSVVSIYANKSVARLEDNIEAAVYNKSVTNEFISEIDPEINIKNQSSLGSGVIVGEKGLVITNSHIVADALDIRVLTVDNKEYEANVVALDKSLDLAILQIATSTEVFKTINFADSDSVLVGDVVFALGNPFGIGQSASMGIVSAIGRSSFNMEAAEYLIQTDAAINPGNSGGALIDVDGNLIGVNSAIFSKTEAFSGVGFSVPSNAVKFIIDSLQASGEIQRAWLGAQGEDITQSLQKRLGLGSSQGVYINQVISNGPAEKAGIKAGDVLLKLNLRTIKNNQGLKSLTPTLPVHKKISATVNRNGRIMTLEITLRPISKRVESDKFIIRGNNILSGLVVEKLSPELNYMLNLPLDRKGIAVIDRPQKVSNLNIQVGDLILQINKSKITDLNSLKKVLNSQAPFGWKITLLRAGKKIKIFIK